MSNPKAFKITKETGIMYVDDPKMLKGKEQNVSVVAIKNKGTGSNMETIVVRVTLLSQEGRENRTCGMQIVARSILIKDNNTVHTYMYNDFKLQISLFLHDI